MNSSTPNASTSLLRRLWATSPQMMVSTAAHLAALAAFVVLALVDQRVVNGQITWIKPAKFAISGAIYMATLAWVMGHIEGHRRALKVVSWVTGGVLAVELALIGLQAGRGVISHFNLATGFDRAVFSTMGAGIVISWLTGWTVPVLLVRQRFADPALGSALRLGVIVSMIGASLGGLMTSPTKSQVEVMRRGEQPTRVGAHAVGVLDGGEGLPVMGWSAKGGDLRIAHFAGLHAMQIVPLLGLWIPAPRFEARTERAGAAPEGARRGGWIPGAHRRAGGAGTPRGAAARAQRRHPRAVRGGRGSDGHRVGHGLARLRAGPGDLSTPGRLRGVMRETRNTSRRADRAPEEGHLRRGRSVAGF